MIKNITINEINRSGINGPETSKNGEIKINKFFNKSKFIFW